MFRKLFILFLFLIIAFAVMPVNKENPADRIVTTFRNFSFFYSDELLNNLEGFSSSVNAGRTDSLHLLELKIKFIECRISFKKLQMFSSYFFPSSEDNYNGPVVPEIEDESEKRPQVEIPHGFQVIEACLYSDNPGECLFEIRKELEIAIRNTKTLGISFRTIPADEPKIIEAMQYHVIRTFIMGMAGFDTPECNTAMEETRVTFGIMQSFFDSAYAPAKKNPLVADVSKQIRKTKNFFSKTPSRDSVNFLACLRDYYIPLSKSLSALRKSIPGNYYLPSAMKFDQPSVFNTSAFNAFFYNPRGTNANFSNDVADLGRTLFFDPLFSENNKRACASCHKPELAFTDGVRLGASFHGEEKLARNTPTVLNAALQRNYFYDHRADNLEMQVAHVLTNEKEMKGNFDSLVTRLSASHEYVELFKKVFKGTRDTIINMNSIVNAIAEYERKLVSFNSKFDRNVRGEEKTFTKNELNGFNVYMNKAKCGTCHYLPLFNNLVPPEYTKSEWEIIGTTESFDTIQPKLDKDPGRGGLYGTVIFLNAFKTPTLRNVSLTGPYMHNGAFNTLEEVIEFYDRGGGAGLGLEVPNQTLPSDPLNLTEKEKKDLITFLKTLNDTTGLTSIPKRLPKFPGNSILNERRLGGEY